MHSKHVVEYNHPYQYSHSTSYPYNIINLSQNSSNVTHTQQNNFFSSLTSESSAPYSFDFNSHLPHGKVQQKSAAAPFYFNHFAEAMPYPSTSTQSEFHSSEGYNFHQIKSLKALNNSNIFEAKILLERPSNRSFMRFVPSSDFTRCYFMNEKKPENTETTEGEEETTLFSIDAGKQQSKEEKLIHEADQESSIIRFNWKIRDMLEYKKDVYMASQSSREQEQKADLIDEEDGENEERKRRIIRSQLMDERIFRQRYGYWITKEDFVDVEGKILWEEEEKAMRQKEEAKETKRAEKREAKGKQALTLEELKNQLKDAEELKLNEDARNELLQAIRQRQKGDGLFPDKKRSVKNCVFSVNEEGKICYELIGEGRKANQHTKKEGKELTYKKENATDEDEDVTESSQNRMNREFTQEKQESNEKYSYNLSQFGLTSFRSPETLRAKTTLSSQSLRMNSHLPYFPLTSSSSSYSENHLFDDMKVQSKDGSFHEKLNLSQQNSLLSSTFIDDPFTEEVLFNSISCSNTYEADFDKQKTKHSASLLPISNNTQNDLKSEYMILPLCYALSDLVTSSVKEKIRETLENKKRFDIKRKIDAAKNRLFKAKSYVSQIIEKKRALHEKRIANRQNEVVFTMYQKPIDIA
ncbi:uncharacterized protein MONOS_2492 [Monocercomonoides exilis]|uniref:uncharacterized protein n=1 Tax=Monocercomonoides exilis TaxID=2049356 RepID=UPI00355A3FDE|nr:hypothetical protein MONOS_2492 [Monocercomonoides exilis]|eukprot:MONOS_2492.1-p1 / transcript=MONOS_2492.1 / gene=MONOS_2492 / organism=Monocercomonoides_exilis_PA203 / gene_product=unspecified product / transcript_product=unspecified product / location=Mono_scaffold00052:12966-15003(-) / protein_length=640 / sequence_SO=supercontig / SO=protein_coding / is_pseudo=false